MKLILPFIEVIITTKCNLRCNECSNLIPAYTRMYDLPADEVCRSIDALLDCVDELTYLKIHGGEPLLSTCFGQILQYANKQEKIKNVIIPTNGSYIPGAETMTLLGQYAHKTKLIISNYEYCRNQHDKLIQICEAYGVKYSISREKSWYAFGEVKKYQESDSFRKQKFNQCEMRRFPSLYHGKLYSCSRMANGVYLGLIPCQKEWEFDLLGAADTERKEVLGRFLALSSNGYCDYCTMDNIRSIKSGEQL